MVPSVHTCRSIMAEIGMPEHIQRHSIMVEQAAVLIAQAHIRAGADLSLDIIRAGALLHDIAKAECFQSGENHAARGSAMCLEQGFDEIAGIVEEHVRLRDFHTNGGVRAKEIVYYADKRVNHDKIVSLDERLEKLILRYGAGREDLQQRLEDNFHQCRAVERKLFQGLGFNAEDLSRLLVAQKDV